jgi:hypothetical protein
VRELHPDDARIPLVEATMAAEASPPTKAKATSA